MKITGTITIENGVIEIKLPLPKSVSSLLKAEIEAGVDQKEDTPKQPEGEWRTIRVSSLNTGHCLNVCDGETWSDTCAIFVREYRRAYHRDRVRCRSCKAATGYVTRERAEDINGIKVFVRGAT